MFAEHMAILVGNYRFMPAYKAGRWDGKIRFYNAATGWILTGLLPRAYRDLKTICNDVVFKDTMGYFQTQEFKVDPAIFADTEFGYSLYPDQVFAAETLLKNKRGVGEIATGFGKTVLCAAMFETVQPKNGLMIVPTLDLVIQSHEDFCDFGLEAKTGMYSGSRKDEFKQLTIATWQSLSRKPELMEIFDMIIIDEAHGAKGQEIQKLMEGAVNAERRYGVTGTLPKDKVFKATIEGVVGPTTVEISPSDLIEIERLSKCQIIQIGLNYPKETVKACEKISQQASSLLEARKNKLHFLAAYQPRVERVKSLINRIEGSAVILVNYSVEGKELEKAIPDSVFIDGSTKATVRAELRKRIEDPDDPLNVMIATYNLAAVGLNMKSLKYIVFGSPSKSFIRVVQAIGRVLRIHEDKSMAFILDLDDKISGVESGKDRNKYYLEKNYPVQQLTLDLE